MKLTWLLKIALLTLSGIGSGYVIQSYLKSALLGGGNGVFAIWVVPGLLFGIVTVGFLLKQQALRWPGGLLWVIGSVVAWFIALQLYMRPYLGFEAPLVQMLVSGLIGGGILAVLLLLLVRPIGWMRLVGTVVAGGLFALVMWGVIELNQSGSAMLAYSLAFAIWQVGVGLVITLPKPGNSSGI